MLRQSASPLIDGAPILAPPNRSSRQVATGTGDCDAAHWQFTPSSNAQPRGPLERAQSMARQARARNGYVRVSREDGRALRGVPGIQVGRTASQIARAA